MNEPGAWIFDLEGTLYRGSTAIPGAAEALARLRSSGRQVRFLTNTTSRGRAGLVERLGRVGIEAGAEEIFCPGAAAAAWLRSREATARLLVAGGALGDFAGVDECEPPDYVVVGDLGEDWSFATMNGAFRDIHDHGAGLIGLARSRYWLADDGLRLDVGPFLAALEYATGVEAKVFGKPAPAIFEAVLDDLGLPAGEVAMVGDDLEGDVLAAVGLGLRGVLVRTGKHRDGPAGFEANGGEVRVVDSVAELA